MFSKLFVCFCHAIGNEICVDKNVLDRLGRVDINYIPVRPLKSLKFIDSLWFSNIIYFIISVFCVFALPVFFFFLMLKTFFIRNHYVSIDSIKNKNFVLIANSRTEVLMAKLGMERDVFFININQDKKRNITIDQFLNINEFLLAYFYSVVAVFVVFFQMKDKRNIPQTYIAYKWFLVSLSILKLRNNADIFYFSNHYDRWAVMFDELLCDKTLILLQHGVLPDNLVLEYQLKNLDEIFVFDEHSKKIFEKLFDCRRTRFRKINLSLSLVNLHGNRKSILVIGQPQSMNREVDIVSRLGDSFDIFVKPHPLYDDKGYSKIKNAKIIRDSDFFPRVDIALCYESTLGLEYEANNVPVVWWRGMSENEIKSAINTIINK